MFFQHRDRNWFANRKSFAAVTLCCLGLFFRGATFSQDTRQDSTAQSHADRGLALAQSGNLISAEEELRRAVALAPGDAEFLADLGTVLAIENKLKESTDCFERALKLNPQDMRVRQYLAANLWRLHQYAQALQHLHTILKANPQNAEALLLLGMVAENTGDFATAARTLASVPVLVRQRAESMAALAKSYYRLGRREDARSWLQDLRKHPSGTSASFLAAQVADDEGDFDTALQILLSLRPSFADHASLSVRLAQVHSHAGHFEDCRRSIQESLDAGQENAQMYRVLGWCDFQLKRGDDAIHDLQESVRLGPTDETNYLELGRILLALHRRPAAHELAVRMTGAFPHSVQVLLFKGEMERSAGRVKEAIDSFSQALKLDPANADATIGLARAQAGGGSLDQAKTTLEAAIPRTAEKARLEVALAEIYLGAEDSSDASSTARAEQLLNSALSRDSFLAEAHFHLGNLALRQSKNDIAATQLEQAAKLNPNSAKVHFALARLYRRLGRERDAERESALYKKWNAADGSGGNETPDYPAPQN